MAGLLIVPGLWPVFDANGDPVSGATINFYEPNTTTPKAVYSDATLSTSLGTSLTTNAGGEPTTLAGSVARLWWAPNGQAYDIQVVAGASTRTWSGVIISEPSSVNSFTASYWGASPTATATVNRNSIQAAIDYVSSLGGGIVDIDVPGYYNIAKRTAAPTDRALNVPKGVNIRGLGTGAPQDSGVALVTLVPAEDMTMFIAGNTMMSQTCTISNASPAVITANAHGKAAGDVVYFATTGTLPAPLIPMFPYYVLPSGLGTNSFQIGLSGSTPAINTTTVGSGVHTLISASSLTHSFGMSNINIYGGGTANVQCLIAESTVGAEWDNVLVEPGNPSAQKHGWLHAANSLAAWLNQYTRLQVGGFTAGVGAAHYGSDSSYSQCLFSGSGVNFRFSEGSISIDGGQCENGNNGGGIGTGRGMELVPSNTGRNVAISIRCRFVANNGDIYIYDSPTGAGFNGRVLIDSTHHDCRATNISIGVNFNNVTIDGTFNEQNPAGTPHVTWRGASTGCVVQGNFSEGVTTRFSGLPADALVLSGGNGQLNQLENLQIAVGSLNYNEALNALGRVIAIDSKGSTVTVPASKNYNYIGIRNSENDNNFVINANALAAGYTFYMRSLAGSSASSNLYGVIGQLNNAGAGSTKAIYGRSSALSGCTGVIMGGVFAVDTVAGLSDATGVQISLDTTAGGKVNKAIWVNKNAATTVSLDYGFLLDDVAIQAGGAGFQMFAKGSGDFLTLKNSSGSANLFSVDSTGCFSTDINVGTTTNGVRVTSSAITRTAAAGNLTVESGLTGTLFLGSGGQHPLSVDQNKANINNPAGKRLNIQGTGSTTVGAAGGAAALPATPLGYFTMQVNGIDVKVPYYNV